MRPSHRLPIAVVSHHPETCGGWLMEHLQAQGPLQVIRPLCGQPLPDLHQIRGIVVLGSNHSVHDHRPGLEAERQWLTQALTLPNLGTSLPILGICFGAQLIAQIGGCHVFRGPHPEIGAHAITPAPNQPWLTAGFDVMQWHNEGIEGIPEHATLVARGQEAFPVQAFQWNHALALQFHPETTPGMVHRWARQHGADESLLQHQLAGLHAMRAWFERTLNQWFPLPESARQPELA